MRDIKCIIVTPPRFCVVYGYVPDNKTQVLFSYQRLSFIAIHFLQSNIKSTKNLLNTTVALPSCSDHIFIYPSNRNLSPISGYIKEVKEGDGTKDLKNKNKKKSEALAGIEPAPSRVRPHLTSPHLTSLHQAHQNRKR